MSQKNANTSSVKWLQILFSAGLLVSFFLPWVIWDNTKVSGYEMPSGGFFKASEAIGGPANPFPQFSFALYTFWLIPVLAVIITTFAFLRKKTIPFAFIAGALSLSLITVFILFTSMLIDLGIGTDVFSLLKPAAYIQTISAAGLIITAFPVKNIAPKIIWLLIGPVIAYGSFKMGEKYIMGETHAATENVKADYTLNSADLIKEFITNDTATNKKYIEKILIVNGNTSAVEVLADSTSTIKFEDSTGSYIIFSLEKNQVDQVKNIKKGDPVSLKGVCSGSIFSEILGTTSISFKRATLNKK
jgi:tRNA_anti-like